VIILVLSSCSVLFFSATEKRGVVCILHVCCEYGVRACLNDFYAFLQVAFIL
jgi:hypothetical protein